jgi:hypothetical protein
MPRRARMLKPLAALVWIATQQPANAQESGAADLSQALQNPLANFVSVPFQSNFDRNGGPRGDGFTATLNLQPVIPFALSDDWTLITRTILPFVHSERIAPDHATGLGDVTQSFFFSPRLGVPGLTLGFGPVVVWPTGTTGALQGRQWGAGPTGIVVQQSGPWTVGLLANHVWRVADSADRQGRPDLNATFLQPFVSRNFPGGFALTATLESSYDWTGQQWTLPLAAGASQLVQLGQVPVNLGVQARYWLDGPSTAPEWGLRFIATLVLR